VALAQLLSCLGDKSCGLLWVSQGLFGTLASLLKRP
jgi:hypothetical protein